MDVDVELVAGAALGTGKQSYPSTTGAYRTPSQISRPVTVITSYAGSGLTYGFMVFPQVTPNKIWEVVRVGGVPADPFTAVATQGMVFRSSTIPQDSANEPTTFGDFIGILQGPAGALQLPGVMYPQPNSVFVRSNERIVVVFKGLANATQVQGSMDIIEHDLGTFLMGAKDR